jgi:AcrR family transcriptional regulator
VCGVAREKPEARAHTGRRRNEAARLAILRAVARVVEEGATLDQLTIDRIAAGAGVGRQTIYRWWPSKGAVLAEAMADSAQRLAPRPDSGSLRADLQRFLTATFDVAGREPAVGLLRSVAAEAQRDPATAAALAGFAGARRAELVAILDAARDRGEVHRDADAELLAEQAFGVLWYRIAVSGEPVDPALAQRLTAALLAQVGGREAAT